MRCRIGARDLTPHRGEASGGVVAARRDQNEETPTMRPRACREGDGVVDAKGDLDDRIDDAYRTKYRRYSPGIAGSVLTPQARSATIRLIPRPTTS